ncbi:MAG: hypothetical protein N2513_02230 [Deltaproteobacteria bacterium]|nr:hypothetical protein [Deltaproteobacteria bacterium]
MKKRTNRRALYVFLLVTGLYAIIILELQKKIEIRREGTKENFLVQSVAPIEIREKKTYEAEKDVTLIFPCILVFAAIKEGQIDEDYLILVRRGDNISWKKPLEIIRDKDREGFESLSRLMGKTYLTKFLEKEGVNIPKDLGVEAIFQGKGYVLELEKLNELKKKYVPEKYSHLLLSNNVITEGKKDYAEEPRDNNSSWIMPDLRGYTMRDAVLRLSAYTRFIRIEGFGEVEDQEPKPNERLRGEIECVLRGRLK